MPEPVEIEVLTLGETPAARATLDMLSMLGLKATVTEMDRIRRDFWRRKGYPAIPIVMVWRGNGRDRCCYMMWDGHRPKMLELTHRLATTGA